MSDIRDVSRSFFRCSNYDFSIGLMKPNETFTIYGIFRFRVLYGRVIIRGKIISSLDKDFSFVSAPYFLGPPVNLHAVPRKCANISKSTIVIKRIKKFAENAVDVLNTFESTDTIVLFQFKEDPVALFVSGLYGTGFFIPHEQNKVDLRGYRVNNFCYVLNTTEFPPLYSENFAKSIDTLVNGIYNEQECKGTRVITAVVGPKNVGKSTLARALVTMLYKKNGSSVYLLDADVGQSECTPPGCVSLWKINSPLFDASVTSQMCVFPHCYFFGSVTPDSDSDLYVSLILDLVNCFKNESEPMSILVINTCGWVEGKGEEILDFLMERVSPTFVFNLMGHEGVNYHISDVQLSFGKKIKVISNFTEVNTSVQPKAAFNMSASTRRDLLTASYFAKNLPLKAVWALSDVPPLAVLFKTLYIYIHPLLGPLPETHIFAALNCTLVALCTFSAESDGNWQTHKVQNKEDMPSLIDEESIKLHCIGFGFIRAIDIERGLMYVITPIDQESLRNVNVFARGINVDMPSYFMTQQHCNDPPYVVSVRRSSLEGDMYKGLRMRTTYKRMRIK